MHSLLCWPACKENSAPEQRRAILTEGAAAAVCPAHCTAVLGAALGGGHIKKSPPLAAFCETTAGSKFSQLPSTAPGQTTQNQTSACTTGTSPSQ